MKQSNQLCGINKILGILLLTSLLITTLQSNSADAMMTYGVTITKATFNTISGNNSEIDLSIINTCSLIIVIETVKVNGETCAIKGDNITFPEDYSGNLVILLTSENYWVNGTIYKMDLYDSNKQLAGSYQALATPPEPTPTPTINPEPFRFSSPNLIIAGTITILIGLGIIAYFKKYRK